MLNRQIQYGGHEANAHFLSLTAVRRLFAVAPIRIQAWDECFFPFRKGVWRYLQVGGWKHDGLTLFSYKEAGAAKRHENEEAMKEKILIKSICLPKSYIFDGGNGKVFFTLECFLYDWEFQKKGL